MAATALGVAACLARTLGADHAHGAVAWALDDDLFKLGFHELAANLPGRVSESGRILPFSGHFS